MSRRTRGIADMLVVLLARDADGFRPRCLAPGPPQGLVRACDLARFLPLGRPGERPSNRGKYRSLHATGMRHCPWFVAASLRFPDLRSQGSDRIGCNCCHGAREPTESSDRGNASQHARLSPRWRASAKCGAAQTSHSDTDSRVEGQRPPEAWTAPAITPWALAARYPGPHRSQGPGMGRTHRERQKLPLPASRRRPG